MIRTYIRSNFETGVLPDGKIVEGGFGPIRGVLVADLVDGNVRVGYSILHGKDMNDRQKKHGLNKAEKVEAVNLALANAINLETLEGVHTIVKKMLHGFLKRCGSCYLEAKTINGIDITPYRRDYSKRMEACLTISTNLKSIAAGMLKLAERMEGHAYNAGRDDDFSLFMDAAIVTCLKKLTSETLSKPVMGQILNSYSHREATRGVTFVNDNIHKAMTDTFGEVANIVPSGEPCKGCGNCH